MVLSAQSTCPLLYSVIAAVTSFVILAVANPSSCHCHAFTFNTDVPILPLRLRSCTSTKPLLLNSKSQPQTKLQMTTSSSATTPAVVTATVQSTFDRSTSQQMVDQTICPRNEERERNNAGMEAFDGDRIIKNKDPRSEFTYGEFPYESFDILVDRALEFVQRDGKQDENTLVDLGSGCGRLVFHAGLTRGGGDASSEDETMKKWSVHGVEIGTQLHSLAVSSLQRGIDNEWFQQSKSANEEGGSSDMGKKSEITFHNGNALLQEVPYFSNTKETDHSSIQSLLSQTNILFFYSTVAEIDPAIEFDPEIQAMIMHPRWSKKLAELLPKGCVAITTDRALNPEDGWKLLDRIDVENPSVWGSVGYISLLEK